MRVRHRTAQGLVRILNALNDIARELSEFESEIAEILEAEGVRVTTVSHEKDGEDLIERTVDSAGAEKVTRLRKQ